MTTRILIVDDHAIMREGLRAILETGDDLHIVGEADNGRRAVEMADRLCPDVVIMDVNMAELNGVEATRQITTADPKVRVVALSAYGEREFVLSMLQAGAVGYVLKSNASDELMRALAAVQRGQKYLSPQVAGAVVDVLVAPEGAPGAALGLPLSPREREVLQLVAEGCTSPQIGRKLHIATRTVDTHRRNIMEKLDLHSVADLTRFALRHGLTSTDH